MNSDGLRKEILEWLSTLTDEATLEYLKVVKDSSSQTSDWWNELSSDQKKRISTGLQDIQKGNTVSHEDVKAKYGL